MIQMKKLILPNMKQEKKREKMMMMNMSKKVKMRINLKSHYLDF